jgi:hypothetical protein
MSPCLQQTLVLPHREPGNGWRGRIDLTLSVEPPAVSRRLDFEVNSGSTHHVRLVALVQGKGRHERRIRFKFPLTLSERDTTPVLIAAPSRGLHLGASRQLMERYGAKPFKLVRLRATTAPQT